MPALEARQRVYAAIGARGTNRFIASARHSRSSLGSASSPPRVSSIRVRRHANPRKRWKREGAVRWWAPVGRGPRHGASAGEDARF